jgi:hypothetical protein
VLLIDVSNALDVLWEKYEEIAKADQQFYDKRYQRKKAKWLEDNSIEYLLRIFPEKYLYKSLDYPDPDKSDKSTSEIDIVINWGPFLVLVEVKAKQFRMESQLGDIGRLITDVKANIEDAFEQAKRVVRYINQTSQPIFIERNTKRELEINKKRLRRIYLLTISQHNLSGLTNRLSEFEDFGLFTEQEYPLSICAADLDTISTFCEGPDIFLHYIERRLEIQHDPVEMISDELEVFGAYLANRLQADRIWKDDGEAVTGFSLTGFQEQFDQWMYYKRGDVENPPAIKLEIPSEISEILTELPRCARY